MTHSPRLPQSKTTGSAAHSGLAPSTIQALRQLFATARLGLYVLIWVILMSLPVFFVVMAMVGEFRFTAIGVPTQDVLRIWLVKEPNERGFGFSVPRVVSKTEHELYVQTNVSYLLWEGVGESISYCVGHARDHVNDDWVQFKMSEGVCNQ